MTAPETFYLVTTTFSELGWGSEGDPTSSRQDAFDLYADGRNEGRAPQVFRIETRADGRRAISEITEDMETELYSVLRKRGLEYGEVA